MKFMFDELSCLIQDLRFAPAEQLWALEPDFQRFVVRIQHDFFYIFQALRFRFFPAHILFALPRSALGLRSLALF
jgi:hypothetical protein